MIDNNKEVTNKKKSLGRGMSSLLGDSQFNINDEASIKDDKINASSVEFSTDGKISEIGIEKLKPGQFQPRKTFDKKSLEELASSLKSSGLIQPIVVRKSGVGFEIIAGERRWRAAQIAGLHTVPVIIRNISDLESLEFGIVENIQRENLNPIEEAEAYQELSEKFNLTQAEIAEKVGKDRSTVANLMRLLQLPMGARDMVLAGALSLGHAKILLSIENKENILKLAKKATNQQWSVRKLEAEVKAYNNPTVEDSETFNSKSEAEKTQIEHVQNTIAKKLKTKVAVSFNGKDLGKIEISFYSIEQLNNIFEDLEKIQ